MTSDESGEAIPRFAVLEIATVLSVTVLYEVDVFEYEQAVIALLTVAVLVLVVDDD